MIAPYIALNDRDFTIAMWINPALTGTSEILVAQREAASDNKFLHFRMSTDGSVRMGFYGNDLDSPAGTFNNNTWYHVAFVYDADAGQQRIIVDGVQIAQRDSGAYQGTTGDTVLGAWVDGTPSGDWWHGIIDDVQIYQNALTETEVTSFMEGLGSPGLASAPKPGDGTTDNLRDSDLSWSAGKYPGTHNVYMGTDPANLELVTSNMTDTALELDRLTFGQTYYWRVDEVNTSADKTVYEGSVWSFEVEPLSYKIDGNQISVVASSYNAGFDPNKTIDGSGLNENNMHTKNGEDMWFSLPGADPTWIQYEFSRIEKLDTMLVWNSNQVSESSFGQGFKEVEIATSIDGENWTVLEDANEFAKAPGKDNYLFNTTVEFNGTKAKFVKITAISSWNEMLASIVGRGLSEVAIYSEPVYARSPKPNPGSTNQTPDTELSWRAGRETATNEVYMGTDPNSMTLVASTDEPSYVGNATLGQTHYWSVTEVNEIEELTAYASDVWSFTTADYVAVEDFETYSNETPDRPFQTWIDGIGFKNPEPGNPGNNTGSGLGYDIWTLTSPYYELNVMETGKVIPGSRQSLPFYYDNSGANGKLPYSQMDRTFSPAQDWILGGATTLVVNFHGDASNTGGSMYIKVNGKKLVNPDSSDLKLGMWHQWNIPLDSIPTNVSSVTSLNIGIEGSGSGLIFIDDLRLYREAPATVTPVEPSTNGLVAAYDFENNVQDVSGNGHNGTLIGTTNFASGYNGLALELTGSGSVDLGTDAVFNPTGSFSVSIWANITNWGNQWAHAMIGNRGEDGIGWQIRKYSGEGSFCFTTRGIGQDDTASNANAPLNEWVNIVCVYDNVANTKTIYINGSFDRQVNTDADAQIAATTHNTYIGARATGGNDAQEAFFEGMLDEIRIYDRPLTAAEARYIAGDR